MRPLGKVKLQWSPQFAYAIGLLVTDGCLSKDGRHIDLSSNDIEQLENFMICLGIKVKIGYKTSGYTHVKQPHIQFGDVLFYQFLVEIGLMPAKSKVMQDLKIPSEYFFDFLRGHFDGDGTFYSYFDPRWRKSFLFYLVFMSASKAHVEWIRSTLKRLLGVGGHLVASGQRCTMYQLRFGKAEALKILQKMYYNSRVICLSRKRIRVLEALQTAKMTLSAGGETG